METLRKLQYRGTKSLPRTIEANWLSGPVVIDAAGECVCKEVDARALVDVNPRMFIDLGEVEHPEEKPVKVVEVYTPKKPAPKKRKAKAKKE